MVKNDERQFECDIEAVILEAKFCGDCPRLDFELNNSDGWQRASITIPAGFACHNHAYLRKGRGG